ncbi:MAG: DUF4864 domain-containing protein [Boseongicola sp. SB0673_bin_14]|nr:DUF4864 domain-containing protein [Boseongicola sp. SB0673_bin_14]
MNSNLRSVVVALALCWACIASAADEPARAPGIGATIEAQIDAFLKDDFARAFSFASPGIQGLFGNHQRFGLMVRNGYPMVWRPSEVRFLRLREVKGALWQRVLIRDRAGGVHLLDYQMVGIDGNWRINGVHILREPDVGT